MKVKKFMPCRPRTELVEVSLSKYLYRPEIPDYNPKVLLFLIDLKKGTLGRMAKDGFFEAGTEMQSQYNIL